MAKYDILSPLKRNGELLDPGESIEISDKKESKQLLDCDTIGVPGSYKKSLETMKTLEEKNKDQEDAILELQKENTRLMEEPKKLQKENANLKAELKKIATEKK